MPLGINSIETGHVHRRWPTAQPTDGKRGLNQRHFLPDRTGGGAWERAVPSATVNTSTPVPPPPDVTGTPPAKDFSVADLLDIVNPLHHIPIVGDLYRATSGDEIKPPARILGGGLFGGVLSAVAGFVNTVIEDLTGKDVGNHAMDLLSAVFRKGGPGAKADTNPDAHPGEALSAGNHRQKPAVPGMPGAPADTVVSGAHPARPSHDRPDPVSLYTASCPPSGNAPVASLRQMSHPGGQVLTDGLSRQGSLPSTGSSDPMDSMRHVLRDLRYPDRLQPEIRRMLKGSALDVMM